MMRVNWSATAVVAIGLMISPTLGRTAQAQSANAPQAGTQRTVSEQQSANNRAPFAPPSPAAQAQLQEVLQNWENQSKGTKTLELKFLRFHYDGQMAPSGVPATKAEGEIKYAAPDRGLIRVDQLVFFNGMVQNNPSFKAFPNRFGEHWVCNGKQLIEFDRTQKECKIEDLPPDMQGKNIINSPLPFVFNLDATQLQQRYWVQQTQSPSPDVVLLEVWPKTANDRSQYKMVQVALEAKTYLPRALVMYAPNFDPKTAAVWDHYEFQNVKRNSIAGQFANKFLKNFIPQAPPKDWQIIQGTAFAAGSASTPTAQQARASQPTNN